MPAKTKSAPLPAKPANLKEMSLGRRDIRRLKLSDCDILAHLNPRTTVSTERLLAMKQQLIAAAGDDPDSNGQREPARGHMLPNGKFGLTTGKTRHMALSELAQTDERFNYIEVTPEPRDYTDLDRDLDHIVTNDGAPLLMSEQATVYLRLRDTHKLTVRQIAAKVGKTEQHIYDCLALLNLPAAVTEAVNTGQIAASTVVTIAKKVQPELVASTVQTAIAAAALAGKQKATNKHVPKSAGGGRSKVRKKDDLQAATSEFQKQEQTHRMEAATEYQADSVSRLQDLLNGTVPSRCVTDRRLTVERLIDYLQGTKTIAQMITFLGGQEEMF